MDVADLLRDAGLEPAFRREFTSEVRPCATGLRCIRAGICGNSCVTPSSSAAPAATTCPAENVQAVARDLPSSASHLLAPLLPPPTAQWLAQQGLRCERDDLLITNGAAHAIFIALASLAGPDDVVLCEQLTDHGVIGNSQVLGFTLKGVEVDREGIDPEHFEDLCANERITALVCTPNLNDPTSSLMSDTRRREIAAIAQRFGVYVIEDDVYGPLLGEGRAPPLSHYLPELSFYCTSFTKSVLTGLRIGYLVVPRRLALRTESILRVNSWMAAPLLAEVATRWIHNGNAQALVERQRRLLAARQALVAERFAEHLLGHAPQALSCWMGIPEHWELDSLVRELRHRHIAVTSPDPFMVRGTPRPRAVRLCMGAECSDERMAQALDDMRELFEQYPKIHDF